MIGFNVMDKNLGNIGKVEFVNDSKLQSLILVKNEELTLQGLELPQFFILLVINHLMVLKKCEFSVMEPLELALRQLDLEI